MNKDSFNIVIDFDNTLQALRKQLESGQERLVLVESCTAGIVCGLLGQIPGISQFLCGSMVVYRNESKAQWLGIPRSLLDDPDIGPVSHEVTQRLALAALERTPEATIAAAITGHLGPNAPLELDGHVFCCVARRQPDEAIKSIEQRLSCSAPLDNDDWRARKQRQLEAAKLLILLIDSALRRAGEISDRI